MENKQIYYTLFKWTLGINKTIKHKGSSRKWGVDSSVAALIKQEGYDVTV